MEELIERNATTATENATEKQEETSMDEISINKTDTIAIETATENKEEQEMDEIDTTDIEKELDGIMDGSDTEEDETELEEAQDAQDKNELDDMNESEPQDEPQDDPLIATTQEESEEERKARNLETYRITEKFYRDDLESEISKLFERLSEYHRGSLEFPIFERVNAQNSRKELELKIAEVDADIKTKKNIMVCVEVDDARFQELVDEIKALKQEQSTLKQQLDAFLATNKAMFDCLEIGKGIIENVTRIQNIMRMLIPTEISKAQNKTQGAKTSSASNPKPGWKLDFISANPQGVTIKEITNHGTTNGYLGGETPEATVRSDLRRLQASGKVRVENGRVFAC